MKNENIVKKINYTLEELWLLFEKKEREYMEFRLNNQQYALLGFIIQNPSCSPSDLAEKMSITKSAISQQLVKLENDGYIFRKQQIEDKRAFSIELDEKGKLYKKEMTKFIHQLSQKYYENFSYEELSELLSILKKLKKIFD